MMYKDWINGLAISRWSGVMGGLEGCAAGRRTERGRRPAPSGRRRAASVWRSTPRRSSAQSGAALDHSQLAVLLLHPAAHVSLRAARARVPSVSVRQRSVGARRAAIAPAAPCRAACAARVWPPVWWARCGASRGAPRRRRARSTRGMCSLLLLVLVGWVCWWWWREHLQSCCCWQWELGGGRLRRRARVRALLRTQ